MMSDELKPQSDPQEEFLITDADIAIYGGAAGSGKSFALCLECLYHIDNPGFGAVLFRRTSKQVRAEGGLWDRSCEIFPVAKASPKESILQWIFPSGAKVTFAHLEHEKDKYNWDGSQIPYIGFDELIHFSESQFFYMLSRNRSTCGVKPYIRATTNPDADSWVANFIAWWINQETGYPILERSGILRWFYRIENRILWYSSKDEAMQKNPDLAKEAEPKSVTFIAANIYDNPALLKADPSYLANLMSLSLVERERLFKGNWKVRAEGGNMFNRSWWKFVNTVPDDEKITVRFWDKAATEDGGAETAGVKMSRTIKDEYYIEHVVHGQWSTFEREKIIKDTAEMDGKNIEIHLEQEPGSSGKDSALITIKQLAGFEVRAKTATGSKVDRAKPFSAQTEAGNCYIVKGDWNMEYIDQHHNFPNSKLKDMVDASSGAFNILALKEMNSDWASLTTAQMRESAI
jgi:predicted phage terminase large subunit-like protein